MFQVRFQVRPLHKLLAAARWGQLVMAKPQAVCGTDGKGAVLELRQRLAKHACLQLEPGRVWGSGRRGGLPGGWGWGQRRAARGGAKCARGLMARMRGCLFAAMGTHGAERES